jgi:hypothetical protein
MLVHIFNKTIYLSKGILKVKPTTTMLKNCEQKAICNLSALSYKEKQESWWFEAVWDFSEDSVTHA